jgi:hypothetical protein
MARRGQCGIDQLNPMLLLPRCGGTRGFEDIPVLLQQPPDPWPSRLIATLGEGLFGLLSYVVSMGSPLNGSRSSNSPQQADVGSALLPPDSLEEGLSRYTLNRGGLLNGKG